MPDSKWLPTGRILASPFLIRYHLIRSWQARCSQREDSADILAALCGISRQQFSRYKLRRRLSDESVEQADRHLCWACDFIQGTDVLLRSRFGFVIVELGSRGVVHRGSTRNPTDAWLAQQLREATPFQPGPTDRVREHDRKYGQHFAAVATGTQIEVLPTPLRAPKANAIGERFIGSVRREGLDHRLVVGERHRFLLMKASIAYDKRY